MRETVKALCALSGVSSCEDQVRAYLEERLGPHVDEIRTDVLGNLIVVKRGKKPAPHQLMLCAHMDEVGLMVTRITTEGYLKFDTVGGIDRRVLLGKRVFVGEGRVPGVIGLKAFHLVSREEEKKVPKLEEFYIDIGASDRDEAKGRVSIGDYVVFSDEFLEFGNGMLKAKAIDDRVGCAVLVKLLEEELPMDCTAVFTAQEEVGARGAFAASFSVSPKLALVLEGTTAADNPVNEGHKQVCAPGKGPVLPFMDGGTVYDRALFEQLRDLAEANGIPWQTKHYLSGGTDASAIQRSKAGVRVAAISAAVRYLHAPTSVASLGDLEDMLRLTRHFVAAVADTL
jgi:putative aminopeptidase FrvX